MYASREWMKDRETRQSRDPLTRNYQVKRGLDLLAAFWLLVWTAPLILLLMMTVKLTSRGPAILRQRRLGRHGKEFTIYKIRSMYFDAEAGGPKWCVPGDPRVTPVGRFLRWSHLDELPQLWNILRGEMSIVGPRPERPEFVRSILLVLPTYHERHRVLPGVTGLAQVQQPPDTDIYAVRSKLKYDLMYINKQSLWLDLRILMSTPFYIVGCSAETIAWMFGLPDPEPILGEIDELALPPVASDRVGQPTYAN